MSSTRSWLLASPLLLGAAVGAAELWRRWRSRRGDAYTVAGLGRARRHRHVLPSTSALPELALDLLVASPPAGARRSQPEGPELVFYVLDPEPIMFGAAALFAFSQASYYARLDPATCVEAAFRRMHVVGIGHAAEDFKLSKEGFDSQALRQLRRRDFPPRDHPSIKEGRGGNSHAQRLAAALADDVAPFVESQLLGLKERPVRCLIGASYSAVLALQTLLARPSAFRDFVLGSPSVCFDPEIFEEVSAGDFATAATAAGVGVQILLGEREREGLAIPGNVHNEMAAFTERLAKALRDRGLVVDGVHVLPEEDHGTLKMALVGRGLTWFASRCRP